MFTNAYEGVKKIYKAEILALIGTVLSVIAGVIGIIGLQNGEVTSSGEGILVAAGLMIIVGAILLIVAEIINIIGVTRAAKDETAFKNALYALLAGIAINILISVFSQNQIVGSIGKALSNAAEILVTYYICTGIVNLADRLSDSDMSARGKKIRGLLMGIWVASAVLNTLSALFTGNQTMEVIIVIITIVGGIIAVVAYFLYLGLLGRAKKMLAK